MRPFALASVNLCSSASDRRQTRAVLRNINETVLFLKGEVTMKRTNSHVELIVHLPKLDSHDAHIAKLLSRFELTDLVILETSGKLDSFAKQSRLCTNARPPQLIYLDSCVPNLLLTNGPSRFLRYFRHSRLNRDRNSNIRWRRCAQLRSS